MGVSEIIGTIQEVPMRRAQGLGFIVFGVSVGVPHIDGNSHIVP